MGLLVRSQNTIRAFRQGIFEALSVGFKKQICKFKNRNVFFVLRQEVPGGTETASFTLLQAASCASPKLLLTTGDAFPIWQCGLDDNNCFVTSIDDGSTNDPILLFPVLAAEVSELFLIQSYVSNEQRK